MKDRTGKGGAMAPKTGMAMASKTDKQLIRYIALRSQPAIEELIRRYENKCRALQLRLARNLSPADADEAMQDTWMQIWKYAKSYRGDAAVSSWIYRITANSILMAVRRQNILSQTHVKNSDPLETVTKPLICNKPLPDEQLQSKESVRAIERLLDILAKIKDVASKHAILNRASGYTTKENIALIARNQKVQLSSAAMKSRLHRAKDVLLDLGIRNII